ncbi:MAG: carbohydrate ABC transporter permease [Lachnospiraceae bacterium]|nr:carbohydrate ABC transporter permease [Lachnospiraceae bacterium]
MAKKERKAGSAVAHFWMYALLILLTILSILPFWVMFMNGTRSTPEINANSLGLWPSKYLIRNWNIITSKSFNAMTGFINSLIISTGATALSVYFSSMTAYAIVAYRWKFRRAFFTFIMAVLMIPSQIISIGFYQMMYSFGMNNNFLPLIIPAIASPAVVFYMKQYMEPALPLEIVQAARIDGAGEFFTFNRIVIPIMKPAIATQAIFAFVQKWNELFIPSVLLTDTNKFTMPMMVNLLKGDIYKTEFGSVYLGLSLTVLPLFIVYFLLSKYIIAGVALGSVKG